MQPVAAEERQMAPVSVSVSGLGTVVSEPAGISCPGACEASFPAFTNIKLYAKPDKGQRLLAWSGDCYSPEKSCRLYLDSEKIVQAAFTVNL